MKQFIIFLITIILALFSCSGISQKRTKVFNSFEGYSKSIDSLNRGSYDLQICWIKNFVESDSVIRVRKYHGIDSTKLIICNPVFADQKCEDVIWNSELVTGITETIIKHGNVALIDFTQINDTNVVCHLYCLFKKNHIAMKLRSFQLYKYRIVTISCFYSEDFQSIESFKYDDQHTLVD